MGAMRTLCLCVCLGAVALGCKKTASTKVSEVATVTPMAFVDWLPDDTGAFGYVHLDKPWLQAMEPMFTPTYKAMVTDLRAMLKRRLGADTAGLQSMGFAVIGDRPLVFFGGISGTLKPSPNHQISSRNGVAMINLDDVAIAQVGPMWIAGEFAVIDKVVTAKASPKRLVVTDTAWTQWASATAKDAPAMVTFKRDRLAKAGSSTDTDDIIDVNMAAVVVKATGLHVAVTAKQGKGPSVETAVREAMQQVRARIDDVVARASDGSAGSELLAVFARNYGYAWLDGIAVQRHADELAVDLPWRKPTWDGAFAPAPAWASRAIVPDEFVAAQINLGGPVLEQFLRWSDVLGRPIDRAAVQQQIAAIFAKHLGAPYRDFVAVDVSGGKAGVFVSLVAPPGPPASMAQGGNPAASAGKELAIEPAPWGTAITRVEDRTALRVAVANAAPALPLLQTSKLTSGNGDGVFLRGAIDLTRVPPALAPMLAQVPLVSVELRAGSAGFEAEAVTRQGKSTQVVGMVNMVKAMLKGQAEDSYKKRESLSPGEELLAILQYHQAASFDRAIVVSELGNDRLRFAISSAEMGANYFKFMAPVAAIGIAAAVAIPAFMKYQAAAAAVAGPGVQLAR